MDRRVGVLDHFTKKLNEHVPTEPVVAFPMIPCIQFIWTLLCDCFRVQTPLQHPFVTPPEPQTPRPTIKIPDDDDDYHTTTVRKFRMRVTRAKKYRVYDS